MAMPRARTLWLFLLMGALALAGPAKSDCPLGPLPLTVNFSRIDAPVVERQVSRAQIAALDRQPTSKGYIDLGMTQANLQDELTAFFKVAKTDSGVCAVPVRVDVRIGYSEMTVFLDKRYASGTCENVAIRRHEYRHVDVFNDILASRLPDIRSAIERAGRSGGFLVEAADAESAKAKLLGLLNAALRAAVKDLDAEMDRLQDALDAPASYAAIHASCSRW
jgi:hypothetical protein